MLKRFLTAYGIYLLASIFFIIYATLSITRHNHFLSAWDLSVVDQIMWKYSRFLSPVTTIHAYANTLIFTDHIEFIYALLSPLYWIYNDVRILIAAQAFFISFSVIPMYLLARRHGLSFFLSLALFLSYLLFYGIQNALWNDVHSIVFGASFLAWFVYFLDTKQLTWTVISGLLAMICKEDVAFLILGVSCIYFILRRDKISFFSMLGSSLYLFLVFFVYYPYFTHDGYRFESKGGFFSSLRLSNYINTPDKRESIIYSFASFGFLPFFSPLYLLGALADLTHYFILGSAVTTAQGIALHYRVTLAPLLTLPVIMTLARIKRLQSAYIGVYLILTTLIIQYHLHLPISYLTKQWFWHESASVASLNLVLASLPPNASIVAQVNILPHIAHRTQIYTLWASTKNFATDSPCGMSTCPWFYWSGSPTLLIADTSKEWDIRQLFQDNQQFNTALVAMQKKGIIRLTKKEGTTEVFRIITSPNN